MTPEQGLDRAARALAAGRTDEAETLCRAVLRLRPGSARAYRFLAVAAFLRGRLDEAFSQIGRALALVPADADAHDNHSLYLTAAGRFAEAEAAARQALALDPEHAHAPHNLGLALLRQDRHSEAEPCFRLAAARQPANASVWYNLSAVLAHLGKVREALLAGARAALLAPADPRTGETLARLRELDRAERRAPAPAVEENNRGVAMLARGEWAEAETSFRLALLLDPDLPVQTRYNLALALMGQSRNVEAETQFLQVQERAPGFIDAYLDHAELCIRQHRLTDAEATYRRALAQVPDHAESLRRLGVQVLTPAGRHDEARAAHQEALASRPDDAVCHSNLLFNEQYRPGVSLAGLAEAHAEWERRHAQGLYRSELAAVTRDPDRPLRIGFVSADFYSHPVGLLLAPLLERLGRASWFTACYSNQTKTDAITERLARAAGLWRNVRDLGDEDLTRVIRGDRIDLLIDLSGHTGGNRLLTFARRPAPVQLTWLGYVGTTGLRAIDYLVADRHHVPPGVESHYREKVLRLPDGYLCYEPPAHAPDVVPLPALERGFVTFGCFNSTAKLNPPLLALWGRILNALPQSRLVLKYHWLGDAGVRRRVLAACEEAGIPAGRVKLLGSSPHAEHLRAYREIDLALDTHPYSGGLTTCEACWMGVPVLTFPGETFASRHSLAHLTTLGLTATIVRDAEEYVERAVELGRDTGRLEELRRGLRERMARSPLCDAGRFAANFMAAMRQVWREGGEAPAVRPP